MESNESSKTAVSRRHVVAAGLAPLIVPRHVLRGSGLPGSQRYAYHRRRGHRRHGPELPGRLQSGKDRRPLRPGPQLFAAKVFDTYPTARRYHDYREMFDKEEKNFDALIIAMPDHMHAILLMSAIRMKKHIYCAKPIAHSIGEVRKLLDALLASKGLITKGSIQDSRTDYARSST